MSSIQPVDSAHGFGRGAMQIAAANAAYVLAAYATTTVVARILGPEHFSGFGVVMAWITVLTALLVKGLTTSIAREMALLHESPQTAWRVGAKLGIQLSCWLTAAGILIAPLAAWLLKASDLSTQFAIGALGVLTFGTNAILLSWPTGIRRYSKQAAAQFAYGLSRLLLVIGGAKLWGVEGAVAGYVLAPLLSSIVLIAKVPKITQKVDLREIRKTLIKAIVPVSIVSIAITAYFVIDIFAISAAVGGSSHTVGVYVAYGTLGHVPFFLLQSTSIAMVPAVAAAKTSSEKLASIKRTLTDTFILLSAPTLLLVTAGDATARVIFGSAYHTQGLVVAPIAVATAAVTWMAGLVAVDVALKRMRGSLIITSLGVVLVGVASWAGAQNASYTASTAAWSVAMASLLIASLLSLRAIKHYEGITEPSRVFKGSLLAAVVCLPPLVIKSDITTITVAVICGIVWLALLFKLKLVDVSRSRVADAS